MNVISIGDDDQLQVEMSVREVAILASSLNSVLEYYDEIDVEIIAWGEEDISKLNDDILKISAACRAR